MMRRRILFLFSLFLFLGGCVPQAPAKQELPIASTSPLATVLTDAPTSEDALAIILDQTMMSREEIGTMLKENKSPIPGYEILTEVPERYAIDLQDPSLEGGLPTDKRFISSLSPQYFEGLDQDLYFGEGAYHAKVWPSEDTELLGPSSLASMDGKLLVTDQRGHRFVLLDASGRLERVIGNVGTTPEQFNAPSAVTYDAINKRIYVSDLGNRRLKVLDAHFNVDRLIELPDDIIVTSMAVNDAGTLFISSSFDLFPGGRLYTLNEEDEWSFLGYFTGTVFTHQGEVYAVQSVSPTIYNLSSNTCQSMTGFYHNLYQLSKDQARLVTAFPRSVSPCACVSYGDGLYVLDTARSVLVDYAFDGSSLSYRQTLSKRLNLTTPSPSAIVLDNNHLYFTDTDASAIRVLSLK